MKLEEKIRLWQQRILQQDLLPRDFPDPSLLKLPKIISFLWGRRVGKSSMMMAIIQSYLTQWVLKIQDVIFLDFSELDNRDIDLSSIYKLYPWRTLFFVLDEIQELPDFEKQLTFLYNQGSRIFISWSNAHLLSQDIATTLRWRVLEIHVDILSFPEYCGFKNIKKDTSIAQLDIHFQEYIMWWWYPEIVLSDSIIAKKSLLQSYLDVLIYKDLIDRYRIRNQDILIKLIKSVITSNTKHLSLNKLYNTYKSLWYAVSKNTLYEYMQYLKNIFFVSELWSIYQKSYNNKVYIIDNWYMNLYADSNNLWQKFENTIYKHLTNNTSTLGYIQDRYEVDFSDKKTNRQVSYRITEENHDREYAFGDTNKKNILITAEISEFVHQNVQQIRYNDLLL